MSDTLDWNAKTIAEFRANEGRVGGTFEGAPMALLHHRGRRSSPAPPRRHRTRMGVQLTGRIAQVQDALADGT